MDQSGRSTEGSRLTTSRRTASVAFSVTELKILRGGTAIPALYKGLDRFDVIPFDTNREGSLNGVDGHNKGSFSASRNQDAFHAVQSSAADAHTLSNLEEGVSPPSHASLYECSNWLNLLIRNRGSRSSGSNEAEYTVYAECSQSVLVGWLQFREYVTTEQRQFHFYLSPSPVSHLRDQWQKSSHTAFVKPVGHNFFVASPGE
jgi:hypothetical protein